MDQGVRRGAYEQLHIAGIKGDPAIAATIRLLLRWESGRLFGNRRRDANNIEVVEWARQNPHGMDWLHELNKRGYRRIRGAPGSITLAVAYKASDIDDVLMTEMFDKLLTGENIESGSPISALKRRFGNIADNRKRLQAKEGIGYYIQAWNALREGKVYKDRPMVLRSDFTAANFPDLT
jgi:hypothetical protein